jgi:uncharacterized protein YaiE (UPF0345 family)
MLRLHTAKGTPMSEFTNVTIVKAANIYFDGKVTSRTVKFADGSHKTLGVMLPGDYSFNTKAAESMEILAGSMDIRLASSDDWNTYSAGTQFEVPANSSFDLKVTAAADYCCSYLD